MRRHHQRGCIGKPRKGRNGLTIYYRRLQPDGTWKLKSETVDTFSKKEARAILDERLREANQATPEPTTLTFKEFAETQWQRYCLSEVKLSTRVGYDSALKNWLLPVLGGLPLAAVRRSHVQQVMARGTTGFTDAQGRVHVLGPKSRSNLYLQLHSMFALAVDLDLLAANPIATSRVKGSKNRLRPRVPQVEKPVLTREQIFSVLAAITDFQLRVLFALLVATGLRLGEALGLQWCDVDLGRRQLVVRRTIFRGKPQATPKTASSKRTACFGDHLVAALEQHRATSPYRAPGEYVFASSKGTPLHDKNVRVWGLYPVLDRLGIPRGRGTHGAHLFRHSAASHLLQLTGNLYETSKFLGHADIGTTAKVYAHLLPGVPQERAQQLDAALLGGGGRKLLATVSHERGER